MTYCLAIKVREGLVCLADGRITAGTQVTAARKVERLGVAASGRAGEMVLMTSGLRSVRDKTIAFFRRDLQREDATPFPSMLDAVDAYCAKLREVREADEEDLKLSNLKFNIHTILAGRMAEDREPSCFLVYPEGNWIEIGSRTPYLSIGETSYGKPILDRTLTPDTDLATALKLAYLSFDSTRISAADVGFPIDMLTYATADGFWREQHYDYDDVLQQRQWWNKHITELAMKMPNGPWTGSLLPGGSGKSRLQVVSGDEDG
ncbi:MAG: peptidase [Alphaproteobacteria bacterium]|nr:peptidase [Alphaproteobacteria bacterium]